MGAFAEKRRKRTTTTDVKRANKVSLEEEEMLSFSFIDIG
jgi:hypothetical protein